MNTSTKRRNPTIQADQFIIGCLYDMTQTDVVVSHSLALAKMINKGLILLYIEDPQYKNGSKDAILPQLQQLCESLKRDYPDISYCALSGKTKDIVSILPTKLNGIVAVAEVNKYAPKKNGCHPRAVLKNFTDSKIAYLTAQTPLKDKMTDVAMTVDFSKESKDKMLWASYYARFNKSNIHILHEAYKDDGLRLKWHYNMKFLDKIFNSLNLTYKAETIVRKTPFIDVSALKYVNKKRYDLLISITTDTRAIDPLELIIGTQERRTIKNIYKTPILFINAKNDTYILCD